jgi:hypothetical protein
VVLSVGIFAWGNTYRLFSNRAFGWTPFLVAYTLVQLAGHNTWESITKFSIQASIIEEGVRVTSSGKGELSAAYEAVDLLVQVLMPPVAGRIFAAFARSTRQLPRRLRWGGGGTYLIGSALMAAAAVTLISTPAPRSSNGRQQRQA